MGSSAPDTKRRRLLACGVLLLALAAGVRLWHDRRPHQSTINAVNPDVESLRRQAAANPGDVEAQIALGSALQKVGRLDEANQVLLDASKLSSNDPRPVVWLAMIAVQRQRLEEGVGDFKEALRRNPSDADIWRALAELYERQGATGKAIPAYEAAVRLRAGDEADWRMLGLADLRVNRLARGREALQSAIRLDPNDLRAHSALAAVALRLGQLEEARQNFDVVLKSRPDDPVALAGIAQASVQLDPSPESLQKAEKQIDRAMALQPTPQCYLTRGQIFLLRHEYSRAIADLERAVREDRNLSQAYGYLSQAYAVTGQRQRARKATAAYQAAQERLDRARSEKGR